MLPSGCDAAEVLARYIGGGDSSVFVQKMNEKALALGMTHTHYLDSYGIGTAEEENISTEEDLYLLMKYD
jgi:D-alanyl-D-alanine carboxypeptidase